jgi:hypothetical protein
MQTNSDSWGFKHYPEYQAISKLLEGYEGPLTEEQKAEIKATEEYENWYEGTIHKKWMERRRKGAKWLKDNPEPDEYTLCSKCEEQAKCQDEGEFFCMEHWPMEEVDG